MPPDLSSLYLVTAAIAVGLMAVLFLAMAFERRIRARLKRRSTQMAGHCRCGYPLGQLAVPRCPECGRVVGFDATAEDLGLTDEQLRRAQRVQRSRTQSS